MLHDSCIHSKYTHLHPLQYGDDAYSIDVFVVDRFGKSGKSSARRARDAAMSADRELTGSHVDLASKIDDDGPKSGHDLQCVILDGGDGADLQSADCPQEERQELEQAPPRPF